MGAGRVGWRRRRQGERRHVGGRRWRALDSCTNGQREVHRIGQAREQAQAPAGRWRRRSAAPAATCHRRTSTTPLLSCRSARLCIGAASQPSERSRKRRTAVARCHAARAQRMGALKGPRDASASASSSLARLRSSRSCRSERCCVTPRLRGTTAFVAMAAQGHICAALGAKLDSAKGPRHLQASLPPRRHPQRGCRTLNPPPRMHACPAPASCGKVHQAWLAGDARAVFTSGTATSGSNPSRRLQHGSGHPQQTPSQLCCCARLPCYEAARLTSLLNCCRSRRPNQRQAAAPSQPITPPPPRCRCQTLLPS